MKSGLPIYDVTPFTLQDFPDKTACIVWFAGCNMRCAYCHNPQIVKGKSGRVTESDAFRFLETRRGRLEGVVLSGGEATLYPGIVAFARQLKKMGFAVKLDTNGSRPAILRALLDEALLDYIALDYKAPQKKFTAITKLKTRLPFDETLDLLITQTAVPVEIRTTVHTSLLDESDIGTILTELAEKGFQGRYFVQGFQDPAGKTLGKLGPQERHLQIGNIPPVERIETGYRNLSA